MNITYKLALSALLGISMVAFSGCAKEEDHLAPNVNGNSTEVTEEASFVQRNVSLAAGIDEEELRLIAGEYVDREGDFQGGKYPKLWLYNTPETLMKAYNAQPKAAINPNISRFYPGKKTYGELTQQDLDNAPYNYTYHFVGGNKHSASVVVYNPTIGESSAAASAITLDARRIGGRDVLIYRGPVNFTKSSDILLKDGVNENSWYAMIFLGARKEGRPNIETLPEDQKSAGVIWRIYQGTRLGDNTWTDDGSLKQVENSSAEITSTNNYTGLLGAMVGLPLASNWSKLTIEGNGSGSNDPAKIESSDMKLRMQGALVQYDVMVNVSDQLDIRRWGIISNTIDVQGSFMLTPENIKQAFDDRDNQAFGVPGWRPEEPNYTADMTSPAAFFLYKRNGDNPTNIDQAQQSFPWDLPSLSTPHATGQAQNPNSTLGTEVSLEAPLYAYRNYLTRSTKSNAYNPQRLLTTGTGTTQDAAAYGGTVVSGTLRSPRLDRENFQRFLFWGMPRKQQPAVPATYFFADVHNGRFLYQSPFTVNSLNGRDMEVLRQENYAAQKSMVLHQTNARFREGRISHIHTTIESDLMITEVAQHVNGDKNYVAIEFTNLSHRAIDLQNYALVRLVPKNDGSRTSYEYYVSDGESTPDIKKARLLPLSINVSSSNNRYYYEKFTSWETIPPIDYVLDLPRNGQRDSYFRKTYTADGGAMLDFQQIFVLTSGAFIDDNNNEQHPFILTALESNNESRGKQTRLITSHKGTILELKKDEQPAFALIRYYDNGRGYRIIDATGPIPTKNGYSEGVSEPYPLNNSTSPYLKAWEKIKGKNYTIERKPGVNFPSIFPYRTDLTFEQLWSVTTLNELRYSVKYRTPSIGYRSEQERLLDGTGTDGKRSDLINKSWEPAKGAYYDHFTDRTPAHDYTWWNTRYFPNIPEPTKY